MNTLGDNTLWSFFNSRREAQIIKTPSTVRKAPGHVVSSYLELVTKVAELQFRNPDFVLMFRGQAGDYRNSKSNTSLKASLFRPEKGRTGLPGITTLSSRYQRLEVAEAALVREYRSAGMLGVERLDRHRMLRWAILQHYEVCPTPLLDVSHSLRVAVSFACERGGTEAFLFVLAVPNVSGAITASAEAGLQIIRLSSVCPPVAVRPHIQEGYLLGEYPDMVNYTQKELYYHYEIDFGRRLLAKFRIDPSKFQRDSNFPLLGTSALYPDAKDPLFKLAQKVKNTLPKA